MSSRRRAALFATAVGLGLTSGTACAPGGLRLSLPSEIVGGARGAIVVLERVEGNGSSLLLQATAIDLAGDVQTQQRELLKIADYSGETVRATVFLFDAGLAEAGLLPGEVGERVAGTAIPRRDVRAFERVVSGDDSAGSWGPAGERSAAIEALRVREAPLDCPKLTTHVREIGVPKAMVYAIVPVDDERALLFTRNGATSSRVVLVTAGGDLSPVEIRGQSQDEVEILTAMRDANGVFWIGGSYGSGQLDRRGIWRGRYDEAARALDLEPIETAVETRGMDGRVLTATTSNVRWMTEPREVGGRIELLTLSTLGRLERHDGSHWTVLYAFPPPRPGMISSILGGLVELGPSRALAVKPTSLSPVVYEDGSAREILLPTNARAPVSVARSEAMGDLVATVNGQVYSDRGEGSFELVGSSEFNLPIHVMVPWKRGLLLAGNSGLVSAYTPDAGFCNPERLAPADVVAAAALRGGRVLIAGGWPTRSNEEGSILLVEISSSAAE